LSSTNKNSPLCIYAGVKALSHIQNFGLSAHDVKVVAGAAGGPKWLVLHGLDQFIFGDWLNDVKNPVHLIGSSIGAWRYAAYCRSDFHTSFKTFESLYFAQTYSEKPDKKEITEEIEKILDGILDEDGISEILQNKRFKLNLFADRSRSLLNSDHPLVLVPGLLLSTLFNLLSRQSLNLFFKRTLFHNKTDLPPFINLNDFPTDKVALNEENLRLAILASGSIPMIVNGIDQIPGAKPGYYRDGGLIDYHMSLPYGIDTGIVLLPHFSDTIIPGWLDKYAGWRKPESSHLEHMLLVAPSASFIESLPLSKIPDRSDFKRFVGDDRGRIQYWQEVTKRSSELSETFQSWIKDGSLIEHIKPF